MRDQTEVFCRSDTCFSIAVTSIHQRPSGYDLRLSDLVDVSVISQDCGIGCVFQEDRSKDVWTVGDSPAMGELTGGGPSCCGPGGRLAASFTLSETAEIMTVMGSPQEQGT